MVSFAYHASHEQFPPDALLALLKQAEAAGFDNALSSDHFHPWGLAQGQSGFAWSWLGAALEGTGMTLGVVNAPGQRYHPAIIAQATATLAQMYPGRFWIAVGSGQAMNEAITGERWPGKAERNARLRESVDIIRALWAGETVTHRGAVCVEEATLFTRPSRPPLLIAAAMTEATARWAGEWADGLITVSQPPETLRRILAAFDAGGGAGKPRFLKIQLSFDRDAASALQGAYEQWRTNIFESAVLADIPRPEKFDAMAQWVRPEDMGRHVRVSAEIGRHLEWLAEDIALGFDLLILHNVNREQAYFIDQFGQHVLPEFLRTGN